MEKHIDIAIWKSAIPCCNQSVANKFGTNRSAVRAVLIHTQAIFGRMLPDLSKHGNLQDFNIPGWGS